jgi:hypothetical protein
MKYLPVILLCFFIMPLNAQKITIDSSLQKKYLPAPVKGLYIGMPLNELKTLRPNAAIPADAVLDNYEESFGTGDVKNITYNLLNTDSSVYEFIVEFSSKAKAIALAKQLYKKPNAPEKGFPLTWKIKLKDGFTLRCWIYESKICIADNRQFNSRSFN